MTQLPLSDFLYSGFYLYTFMFLASAILLLAIYYFRWKSDITSFFTWGLAYAVSALLTWGITKNPEMIFWALGVNLLVNLCFVKIVPTTSLFGLMFLGTMVTPSLFSVIWLYNLRASAITFLNANAFVAFLVLVVEIVFTILILLNSAMICWILLARFSALYFRFPRLKKGWSLAENTKNKHPFVSIHVPCYNEPPEVVIKTLNSLAKLDYPNFEVLLLDNNTKDPLVWEPVEAHCKKLGPQFRFYHIDHLTGAKAGALNACLKLTSAKAELISVMDSDYIVDPDFIISLVGFFDKPEVGFVQACQDYRDWQSNTYLNACYLEYESHFKLELCGQNEWDVNYTIGTMCLIRRKALREAGGWAEWCLTEDSEVAVRIHALGYEGYYLKNSFGYGLIPETYESFKQQRFRWTAGPVQQFKRHWKMYLPLFAEGKLSLIQKFGEIFHSLSSLFSETLNLFMVIPTLFVCLWLKIVYGYTFTIPLPFLVLIPIIYLRNIICNWLTIKLLNGNWKTYILSSMAARSLIYIRNVAFYKALFSSHLKWERTDKFKVSSNFARIYESTRGEIISGVFYTALAILLAVFVDFRNPDMIFVIWLGLINQVISFFCSPAMAYLSELSIRETQNIEAKKITSEHIGSTERKKSEERERV